MRLRVSYKTWKKVFFAFLKPTKKEVGSGVGSGSRSISQIYESAGRDPNPIQNVTEPQHWKEEKNYTEEETQTRPRYLPSASTEKGEYRSPNVAQLK